MTIVLEYKLFDTAKTNNYNLNIRKIKSRFKTEIYHIEDLLDDVKLNVSYRDAKVVVIPKIARRTESLEQSLLELEFTDEICFIDNKLEEIRLVEDMFNKIANLKQDEFYTSYRRKLNIFRRATKQPFTIGLVLHQPIKLKIAWFVGTVKISPEQCIELNVGDIFILDNVCNGCFLGAHGLCVKFCFVP